MKKDRGCQTEPLSILATRSQHVDHGQKRSDPSGTFSFSGNQTVEIPMSESMDCVRP